MIIIRLCIYVINVNFLNICISLWPGHEFLLNIYRRQSKTFACGEICYNILKYSRALDVYREKVSGDFNVYIVINII